MLYSLARLEETALSTWLRESGPAFFTSLTLHSLAMAVVVGFSLVLAFAMQRRMLAADGPDWTPPTRRLLALNSIALWLLVVLILAPRYISLRALSSQFGMPDHPWP